MQEYTNDKGEKVIISEMESRRLIHAIAKYALIDGQTGLEEVGELVKALKAEAIKRLTPATE